MFGLTFEKLILIAVIAAFIIGPTKLPLYATKLGQFVQQLRGYTQTAKDRVKQEMGPEFDDVEWKKLDPRQYDPRRIIRDALLEDSTPEAIKTASTKSPVAESAEPAARPE
ncbi:Sec-independent protein translocase TatB [Subtercola boreus]|uniref:Sec-independent protein translocase TatB n=1 Tax=Subtercola boreus TaxID=120213 RepID=A0A3E0W915_9MICO|nr:Sec-independent protein translocase TatB [Subtercola boreus]RFA18742.1 Sec-independent protein translocase TatB [Subtercola boreus]RFA18859.1 Sec-independent protein translocase TatB [Subtercola boreus]RFA25394.1 Sec-independent protein translocase TatB [Subtercola boreus]